MKQLLITIAALVLVGCGPSKAEQELLDAVKNGNFRDAKQYVVSGADVNRKYGKTKATLLHHAASTGNKDIAELLITKGANINAKDTPFGCTPLHVATEGNKEIVELLISKVYTEKFLQACSHKITDITNLGSFNQVVN